MTVSSFTRDTSDAARAANDTLLVVPSPDRSGILVSGKDRIRWLNGLVTCELAKLGPGEGAYGLLVEKKGRIQTDLFVVPNRDEATLALAVPFALRESLLATLDHYLVMEDAEVSATELVFVLAHGPLAARLAPLAPFAGTVNLLGQGGVVLGVPATDKAAFDAAVAAEVTRLGGLVVDDATWNAVRIERGLPRFGVEVDSTLYPQEAALEKLAVSFSKGCYLGQEVVYMLQERGHVKRRLVRLDVEGDQVPSVGAAVTTPDGATVGDIKSATLGPSSQKPVAIAMVKWAQAQPGTDLRIGDLNARVGA